MNPPFFDRRASGRARDAGRDMAHGGGVPLAAWLALAARRLRPGGTMTLVMPVARLAEVLAGPLGSVEVLPLSPHAGAGPRLMLLRARKGGRAPFRLLAALSMHEGPGFAPWLEAVLRDGAAVPWDLASFR
jgi:tRNA1(Val) A37 N6-methylase TrmN6